MKIMKLMLAVLLLIVSGCTVETEEDTVIINENGINMVQFEDKEMDWFRFGNEEGPKLIILPGISLKSVTGSKEAIISAYSLLAQDYDIYLFDRIREFPEDYDIYDMADDTLRAIRAIGLDEVNIMGVSQGGMMAMVMAVKEPETVKSLMLCSTSSRIGDTSVLETWKKLAEERDLSALMESFGGSVYTPSFFEQYRDLIVASGEGATEQDFRNFIISVEGTMHFDCYEELKNIQCPCIVIAASDDRVLGAQVIDLIYQLQCESFIYEGYGHGVYDEAPDYLTHIKAFLDKYN